MLTSAIVVRFTNKNTPCDFVYSLHGSPLSLITDICDLGVIHESNGKFSKHINKIANKALRVLGFLNRSLAFVNSNTYKRLYDTLVRPILEYSSPVWSPYTITDKKLLESVQHKFMRNLAYKSGTPMDRFDHDYSDIQNRFNIKSLSNRRQITDAIFLYKLFHDKINCPELRSLFRLSTPARTLRVNSTFDILFSRTLRGQYTFINRLASLGNTISTNINFFTTSFPDFCTYLNGKFSD